MRPCETGDASSPLLAPFEIRSPSPSAPSVDPAQGLTIEWSALEGQVLTGTLTLSLLLSSPTRTEQIQCIFDPPSQMEEETDEALYLQGGTFTIPPEYLSFWPDTPDSLKQLNLRYDAKNIQFSFPDRGQYKESVSLILKLE